MILFRGVIGSKLYGTDTEDSDTDIGEVHIEQKSCVFGVDNPGPLEQLTGEIDTQRHWFKDFIKLCVKGNPNVVEWLFSSNDIDSADWKILQHNKHLFLDRDNLVRSHIGFAIEQMRRCTISHGKLGSKRRDLLEKFGFDCKGVSHSIRLMTQLRQLLETDNIVFPLENAPLLLEIKVGNRDLEFCRFLFSQQVNIVRSINYTSRKVNHEELSKVMEQIYKETWCG